jgi:isoquinoline 1-oxidoreductase subunit alpha
MSKFTLKVNGENRTVDVSPDTPLLWVLREHLKLVGTKYGCGVGFCGSCMVIVNGESTYSCSTTIEEVAGSQITTIEGLSKNGTHPVQVAWEEEDVSQCGYCQAGQIISAFALLKEKPKPSDKDIDSAMAGNICRCGTYPRIKKAIRRAAENM